MSWQLPALLLLLPIWCLGLFTREVWMPDEPREYDIAVNMLHQSGKVVPLLGGEPFLEKPPLTYWLASAAMRAFGESPAAARVPNLLFAIVAMLAIGMLAGRLTQRQRAPLFAALAAVTMVLVCQIQIWLSTDAPVFACTAIALLAAWCAFDGSSRERLWWFLLFWIALAGAFMAKNVFGLIVPMLTLLTWIAWERRGGVLRQWQFYAGAVVFAALVSSWLFALWRQPNGAQHLRELLWDNTTGRFFATSTHGAYRLGHETMRFSALLWVPYYVLPWTFASLGAIRWALQAIKQSAHRSGIRFCVCASLPALVLLAFSATARDVYFAPALLGLALLISMWMTDRELAPDRFDRICLRLTSALMIAATIVLAVATLLLWDSSTHEFSVAGLWRQALGMLALVAGAGMLVRGGGLFKSVAPALTGFLLALLFFESFAFPVVDRIENIAAAFQRSPASLTKAAALYCGDETTVAVLDFSLGLRLPSVCGPAAARQWLEMGTEQKLLAKLGSEALPAKARARLAKLHIKLHAKSSSQARELESLGLQPEELWCTSGGRRYALFGRGSSGGAQPQIHGECD